MEEKYLVTTKNSFCTKDGSFKNACWGKLTQQDNVVVVGNAGKEIYFNNESIFSILRCDEKPIELGELGLPILFETELNIYIAE